MTTIPLNKKNIWVQMANIQRLLETGKYSVTMHIEQEDESLLSYIQGGRRFDPTYGPFTTSESLFASLDK